MIRTKVILVFATSLFLISGLLGVHLFETSKEVYFHKRLDSMHHEYIVVLNIKQAVSSQLKEATTGVVFGFSPQQTKRYERTKILTESSIKELMNTISTELDYIFSHEKENEEDESRKAQHLLDKYKEIDTTLQRLIELGSQLTKTRGAQEAVLAEADDLYISFANLIDEWIEHEQKELQNVEDTFRAMTTRNTIILVVGSIITLVFAMTMSLSIILLIIDPRMKELISGTKRISQGDLSTPITLTGNDEFTALSKAFNQMMLRLQSSQKQLLEQSYYSGMAEMVSGILHNIKNAFSPFIVDTEIIYHHVKSIKLFQFIPALNELREDTIDSSRKNDLLDLGGLLIENSQDTLKKIRDKLAVMQNRAALIERIIEEQSQLASSQRLIEEISLQELFQDSLSLIKTRFLEEVSVSVSDNVQKVGNIKTQRIILLQVFKNIILNAIESILRAENKSGKVEINAELFHDTNQEMVHITISDNGEGIKPESLKEIFQRGVSGKESRSGLGLHWCANSIAALQGQIYAESDGPGQGAQLHILIKRN